MSELELQSGSSTVVDFRRPRAAEEMLESGEPKEKKSEMGVDSKETGRLPGDT